MSNERSSEPNDEFVQSLIYAETDTGAQCAIHRVRVCVCVCVCVRVLICVHIRICVRDYIVYVRLRIREIYSLIFV